MEPSLKKISRILIHTCDFVKSIEKDLKIGTVLRVANTKSLYTNISYDLGLKALSIELKNCSTKQSIYKDSPRISSSKECQLY